MHRGGARGRFASLGPYHRIAIHPPVTVNVDSEKTETARTYTTKHGTVATMNTSRIGSAPLDPPLYLRKFRRWPVTQNVMSEAPLILRNFLSMPAKAVSGPWSAMAAGWPEPRPLRPSRQAGRLAGGDVSSRAFSRA
jgi:hypothetical protein